MYKVSIPGEFFKRTFRYLSLVQFVVSRNGKGWGEERKSAEREERARIGGNKKAGRWGGHDLKVDHGIC